jgi:hypothetical protein
MRIVAVACLTLAGSLAATATSADAPALAPFVAEYDVRYGRMAVGSSRMELARDGEHWAFDSTSTATGFARMVTPGALRQHSVFELSGDEPRPLRYSFDDGSKRTDRDVQLEFDWAAGRVRGTAEEAPVDLAVDAGLQDAASMQALVLARLRAGREPGTIAMIEKNKVKHYRYTLLRREQLATALGDLDTVVYRSAREGSTRQTLTWHAPALGFVTVQAEQLIDGKRGFQTRIRRIGK